MTESSVMLPREWASLFMHHLVRDKRVRTRHREISARELTDWADKYANKWRLSTGARIEGKDLLDECFNMGWLVPAAGDTWQIRDDIVRH